MGGIITYEQMLMVLKWDLISWQSQWDLGLRAHNAHNYVFYQMDNSGAQQAGLQPALCATNMLYKKRHSISTKQEMFLPKQEMIGFIGPVPARN